MNLNSTAKKLQFRPTLVSRYGCTCLGQQGVNRSGVWNKKGLLKRLFCHIKGVFCYLQLNLLQIDRVFSENKMSCFVSKLL